MMGETGNQHKVILTKDFYIGVFEVTQGQWEKVMKSNPSKFKNVGKGAPVENVSWDDCQKFCKMLNSRWNRIPPSTPDSGANDGGSSSTRPPGFGFRLPTEAEWEYACRAGSEGEKYEDNNILELGWDDKNSDKTTHEVGKKKPNAWGLYDTLGNVWERCYDWLGDYPAGEVTDPTGPSKGSYRVHRGGSFDRDSGYCRSARRNLNDRDYEGNCFGFRLVFSAGK